MLCLEDRKGAPSCLSGILYCVQSYLRVFGSSVEEGQSRQRKSGGIRRREGSKALAVRKTGEPGHSHL